MVLLGCIAATSLKGQLYSYRNAEGKLVITDQKIGKKGYKLVDTYIPKRVVEERKNARYRASRSGGRRLLTEAQIDGLVYPIAKSMKVDPALVKAMIEVESNRDLRALSHKGAMGLMQLIPETARRFGVENPWDPRQNVKGGILYLRYLLSYFKGDVDLVLAAYNAGEHAVDRHGGIPPYKETRNYVRKVRRLYRAKYLPYGNSARRTSRLVSKGRAAAEISRMARAE